MFGWHQHYISPLEAGLEKFLDALRFQDAHFSNVLERATAGKRKAEEECANLQRSENTHLERFFVRLEN